jgi:hypothetical protein
LLTRTLRDFQRHWAAKQKLLEPAKWASGLPTEFLRGQASMVPVIAGATCVGFLLKRGCEGVEAFDHNERSLGVFADPSRPPLQSRGA